MIPGILISPTSAKTVHDPNSVVGMEFGMGSRGNRIKISSTEYVERRGKKISGVESSNVEKWLEGGAFEASRIGKMPFRGLLPHAPSRGSCGGSSVGGRLYYNRLHFIFGLYLCYSVDVGSSPWGDMGVITMSTYSEMHLI